ncbi:VirB4-like conjugal transfer ATPase, CD1110 family [Enterocloster bolteae]|uniref:VirB4-like conjugal transfer ATPase, CD1110 family n=1 Tax=Enterocloster bolteae TaxID=208479 RepID=UPI00210D467D|nr:DUF87 domain-containing protein [Enterocloster bolteae]MCQ5145726.1 ATP-binding protein [Enterocloster bolteae]
MRKRKEAKQTAPKRAGDKSRKQAGPQTAQQTIPFREMFRDGVCRLNNGVYTKTVEFEDINYQLAQAEDQSAIFDGWSSFLNYFDSALPFQLSFINHRSRPESKYTVNIAPRHDEFDSIRAEYVEMLENQIAKSNNGIVRTKLITFGVPADSVKGARPRLERIEADIMGNFKQLGVQSRPLPGRERLEILHVQLHPGGRESFTFTWEQIPQTGMTTKDFIAPISFDFRRGRFFKVGATWGAASYLQITASELSDKLLAELLELDTEMTVTMHIQTVDQSKAIKTIKGKLSDIDKMKMEEQKKAVRSGYDMDILPPDLVTFSKDAKTLLEDLQSRNERMFLLTFLIVNMAPTREQLENEIFTVSGIAQKYNCTIRRLDFQQEQGFLSSLPLGCNAVEIQRGLTTSSTAIFIPFLTQELRMDGEAIYYGLNALSHNIIMANRKKLKNPNGLFLGVPGSGKSFAAKRELVNVFLATNDKILIVDPMGEYSPLVRRLGGQVVEIAPNSPHHINPMSLIADLDNGEENPMALKADFILSLMELIVGGKDGLQPVERTVIDRCVRLMYRDYLQDPGAAKMPILQDLYMLLCKQTEPEAARLATSLEIYVSGSLNVFNHETDVDLSSRLVCLDLKKLGAGLRTIAMLIMQDLVNSQVSANFAQGTATWCYFDEFHLLLKDERTASYCVTVWKMLRKKFCVPSALTQNVKDLLASREIENIFENSDFLVMLSQAQGDRQILAKQLGISPTQLSFVTNSNSGEGLLFFGNVIIPFSDRFPQNTEIYRLLTTRPEDLKDEAAGV